ncbi:MAG TPA: Na+/H+ antiporter NhaC family protein [Gammaproteobacteria bacterium]|nr:hypothetical protein [Xanthomonadales bacterium]MCB1594811.1 hypothetical protein [Xanthomonadales bacterium]HOP23191.1 Na+/H+ antiporter NhaC family protein [Gammaproteobacteria bacterium]HPI95847.1 Na+/H+ antiporter NhaC family protein [Gammaproteobacteria bacterium]HPQ87443.1 Na+/H+ antiporter NhaC family protein [Gammaproteobacteria bacterium]
MSNIFVESLGFISTLPVLITLVVAVKTRNVILGLFLGVFSGVVILHGMNPFTSMSVVVEKYFIQQITKSSNAGMLVLMTLIGGLVGLMEKSGGAAAFAKMVVRKITSKTKAMFSAWMSGTLLFFTDSGTPLIVGPLFRPIMDGLKISREKLAWIIDSTASPVAVLIPFIGWGLYSQGLIAQEYSELGISEDAFTSYVKSIPYQFYSLLAVVMVPLILILKVDFGSMRIAEIKAQDTQKLVQDLNSVEEKGEKEHENAKPIMVWLPLSVMMVILFAMLIPKGFPLDIGNIPSNAFRSSLSTAYIFAAISLIVLMSRLKIKTLNDSFQLYLKSIGSMFNILIILVLAWSLGAVGKDLGTANYIVSLTDGKFAGFLVPVIAFIIGAIISFATGSSWGTYAILFPLIIPMAHQFDSPIYVSIGAVLSGGLFGDHCSPISDTTILSSTGAGCTHLDHVKTQLPYALFNGLCCTAAFIFAGITASIWGLFLGFILMLSGLMIIRKLVALKKP